MMKFIKFMSCVMLVFCEMQIGAVAVDPKYADDLDDDPVTGNDRDEYDDADYDRQY